MIIRGRIWDIFGGRINRIENREIVGIIGEIFLEELGLRMWNVREVVSIMLIGVVRR